MLADYRIIDKTIYIDADYHHKIVGELEHRISDLENDIIENGGCPKCFKDLEHSETSFGGYNRDEDICSCNK